MVYLGLQVTCNEIQPIYKKVKHIFQGIEDNLIRYISVYFHRYKRGKFGTLWLLLKHKYQKWAEDMEISDFKVYDGCLHTTINFYQLLYIKFCI